MTEMQRRRGESHHGGVDELLAGGVSAEGSRTTVLPVPSLTAALDHLDHAGQCCCWVALRRRCCRARWWSR
ncbi:MAG: hypothetical protein ACRDS1_07825 [Pseudonocardiaceae bacterium]